MEKNAREGMKVESDLIPEDWKNHPSGEGEGGGGRLGLKQLGKREKRRKPAINLAGKSLRIGVDWGAETAAEHYRDEQNPKPSLN